MLPELSLHVLDVAENGIRAHASLITITVTADPAADRLTITIEDDGDGMSGEMCARVTDPFFTTRDTRRIGLGIPFFKLAAEQTGGSFSIESEEGKGTRVTAEFVLTSIDRMPLGDMTSTIRTLVTMHEETDLVYRLTVTGGTDPDATSFTLSTKEMRAILGDISFRTPEVTAYLQEYLQENEREVFANAGITSL